jgi:hypothetical protein
MSKYSVFNPFKGNFDYYISTKSIAFNDEYPTPNYKNETRAGIAALEAGRPLPYDAKLIGSGQMPIGSISSGVRGEWKKTNSSSNSDGIGMGNFKVEKYGPILPFGAGVFLVLLYNLMRK